MLLSAAVVAGSFAPSPLHVAAALAADGKAAEQRTRRAAPHADAEAMHDIAEQLQNQQNQAPALAASAKQQPAAPSGSKAKVQARDLAQLLDVPEAQAKAMLSAKDTKELGRLPLAQVRETAGAFAAALGLDAKQSARLLAKQPRVLLVPAPELRERLSELSAMLAAPPRLAAKLAAKQPGLLVHRPETLRTRLSGLCSVFNVDPVLAQEVSWLALLGKGGRRGS